MIALQENSIGSATSLRPHGSQARPTDDQVPSITSANAPLKFDGPQLAVGDCRLRGSSARLHTHHRVPAHWSAAYRQLVERSQSPLSERPQHRADRQPEYKRRWKPSLAATTGARHPASGAHAAGRPALWPTVELTSCAHLADKVRHDPDFMEVATLYRGRPDFDLTELVWSCRRASPVPFLPCFATKDSAYGSGQFGSRSGICSGGKTPLKQRSGVRCCGLEEKPGNRPKSKPAPKRS